MDSLYTQGPFGFSHDNVENDRWSMGPMLVAIAAAILLNFSSFPELAEQISRDPCLIFLSGILLFIAGLAIVRAHNIWVGGWPVLVTVLGWLAILSGLVRMLFPTGVTEIAAGVAQRPGGDHCRRRCRSMLGAREYDAKVW
jgi:hypothetical protein